MTEVEQITEAEQLAVPDWIHQLASQIVLGNHGVGNAGVLIQRAFEERERALRERIRRLEIEVNGPTPADIGIDPDGPSENAMLAALKDTQP